MSMIKKFHIYLLSLLLVTALTACSGGNSSNNNDAVDSQPQLLSNNANISNETPNSDNTNTDTGADNIAAPVTGEGAGEEGGVGSEEGGGESEDSSPVAPSAATKSFAVDVSEVSVRRVSNGDVVDIDVSDVSSGEIQYAEE